MLEMLGNVGDVSYNDRDHMLEILVDVRDEMLVYHYVRVFYSIFSNSNIMDD